MARSSTESTTKNCLLPHEILGIPKDASEDRVRSAYKALALKWHPDRQVPNRDEATSKFVEINDAHRTMIRNIRRARRSTHSTPSSSVAGSAPPTPASTSSSLPPEGSDTRVRVPPSRATPPSSHNSSQKSHSTTTFPVSKEESRSTTKSSASKASHKSRSSKVEQPRGRSSSRSRPSRAEHRTSAKLSKANPKTTTAVPKSSSSTTKPPSRLQKQSSRCRPDPIKEEDLAPKSNSASKPSTNVSNADPERVVETLHPLRPVLRSAVADIPKRWTHNVTMSLEEIHSGKTFHFRIVRYKQSGKKSVVPLDLYVPPGIRGGTEIIVDGVGNERKDGTWQAVVFLVKEAKHEKFRRNHDDLVMDVRLPWVDSLDTETGQVYFQSVNGKEYKFKVPYCKDGLLSGETVIPDAGLPGSDGTSRGRAIIHWEIASPHSSWDTIKEVLKFK